MTPVPVPAPVYMYLLDVNSRLIHVLWLKLEVFKYHGLWNHAMSLVQFNII